MKRSSVKFTPTPTTRRFEFVEGSSSKFWEIVQEATYVFTHCGRIGTEGQATSKESASEAAATKLLESLVKEKKSKGYVETKRDGAAKPRAAEAPDAAMDDICQKIESYFDNLEQLDVVTLTRNRVLPSKPSAIDAYEKRNKVNFPEDLRAFLTRGISVGRCVTISEGDSDVFGAIGFDFLDIDGIQKATKVMREAAKDLFPDDDVDEDDDELLDQANILRRGIPLSWSEPQLVWLDGALYHFSVRNPVRKVCGSFREFFEAWLACGCFSSHSFDAAWNAVKSVAGKKPTSNVWLDYYRKAHPAPR